MARENIPDQLRAAIQKKLGNVSPRHVNRVIAKIASDELVSRRAAAMLLARKLNISFNRFATADDRAEMRGHTVTQTQIDDAPAQAANAPIVKEAARAVKVTKNNTLFVVHGRDTKLNEDMFGLLRALGLNPIEWSEAVAKTKGNNPDVDKIIGGQMKSVQGIVVDLTRRAGEAEEQVFRNPRRAQLARSSPAERFV